jgi:hypothetical protein
MGAHINGEGGEDRGLRPEMAVPSVVARPSAQAPWDTFDVVSLRS